MAHGDPPRRTGTAALTGAASAAAALAMAAGAALVALAQPATTPSSSAAVTLGPELDVDSPVITGASGEQTAPAAVAAPGEPGSYLVAWRTPVWNGEVRAARVRGAGAGAAGNAAVEVRDPRGVVIDGLDGGEGRLGLAAGGGGYLLAAVTDDGKRIEAARLTGTGRMLDQAAPVLLAEVTGQQESVIDPAVVWAGGGFWVVWARVGTSPAPGDAPGVYAARLSADGQTLQGAPLRLTEAAPAGGAVVAAAGARILVAWPDAVTGAAGSTLVVRGVRVESDGQVLDMTPLVLVGGGTGRADGGAPPAPEPLAATGASVSAAANGTTFLVVASADRKAAGGGPSGSEIRAARLGLDGPVIDAAGLTVSTTLEGRPRSAPAVAWNGRSFVVVWSSERQEDGRRQPRLSGRTVAAEDGRVVDLAMPAGSAPAESPALAVSAPGVVAPDGGAPALAAITAVFFSEVAWWTELSTPGDTDIRGTVLPGEGVAAAGLSFLVSGGKNAESEPAVAWSGEQLLVVWEDTREDRAGADIYAARLGADGRPLGGSAPDGGVDAAAADAAAGDGGAGGDAGAGASAAIKALPIATGPAAQRAPVAAWDGRQFVIAWHEPGRGLVVARVAPDGTLRDPAPVLVPGTGNLRFLSEPALCAQDGGVLLAWGARPLAGAPELRAARVPATGAVTAAESFALVATTDTEPPVVRLSCNEDNATFVWSGSVQTAARVDLHMARLERGARAFTQSRIVQLQLNAVLERSGVATDGRGFLVVWRRTESNGNRFMLFATRVDGAGAPTDDPPLALGTINAGQRLAVAWDGQQYVVLGIQALGIADVQLRALRVPPDFRAVAEGDWLPIAKLSSLRGTGTGVDVVALSGPRLFVAYDQFADPDTTDNQRVRARLVTAARYHPPDAGPGPDGSPDGPMPDAAADPDAGPAGVDASRSDTTRLDAATDGLPRPSTGGSGCSCRAVSGVGGEGTGSASLAALTLLALLLSRGRRASSSGGGRAGLR